MAHPPSSRAHRGAPGRAGPARALTGWALLLAAAALLGLPWAQATAADHGGQVPSTTTLADGAELYAASCATCHGARGEGGPGPEGELTAGPPVVGADVALVDALLRTGRMPIVDRDAGVGPPERFDAEQREATVAWMRESMDLEGEIPEVGEGDVARGHDLYTQNCASCHGSTGAGGVSGDGTVVLGLRETDPVATVSAIRTGPIGMPRFEEALLSEDDATDIAVYVDAELTTPERTALGLGELGQPGKLLLTAGMTAAAAGLLVLVAASPRMVGRRTEDGDPAAPPGDETRPRGGDPA